VSISPRNDALMTDRRLYKKHEVQEYTHPVLGLVITKPACGNESGPVFARRRDTTSLSGEPRRASWKDGEDGGHDSPHERRHRVV
jgi:hypothetical protein